jgi:hypothetical protein
MTLDQLIKLDITDEQAKKVLELYKEKLKDFVPTHRLSEEVEKTKTEKARADSLEEQIEELSKFKGTSEELKAEVDSLKSSLTETKTEYQKQLDKARKVSAVRLKLMTKETPPSEKALGVLLEQYSLDDIKLDDTGEIVSGFDEQDKTISEEFDFCYPKSPDIRVKGTEPDKKKKGSEGKTEVDAFFEGMFDQMID